MYTAEAARRLIKGKGVPYFLNLINSESLPEHIKKDLEEAKILRNGFPCLSLIYSLAK